jgi:hypothetical protein
MKSLCKNIQFVRFLFLLVVFVGRRRAALQNLHGNRRRLLAHIERDVGGTDDLLTMPGSPQGLQGLAL